ncbi:twin transmembrane helix small protein [Palleronia sp.]|uniref:twin transmembrane helix small protein n=1 Tax=Palleronia sp. TaxID=1940284 RepID=UPI0035C7BE9F
MFSDPLFFIAFIACLAVAVILIIGITGFGKGGVENAKRSNKFMRWRIYAQAVAIALILLFVVAGGMGR